MEPNLQEYPHIPTKSADPWLGQAVKVLKRYQDDTLWSESRVPYRSIQAFLKKTQIIFAISLAVLILLLPETREYVLNTSIKGKCIVFLMECSSLIALSWILGQDRLPVNYFCLVFMRLFISLDTKFEVEVSNYESRLWKKAKEDARNIGIKNTGTESMAQLQLKNLVLAAVFLVASFGISQFSKIKIGRNESFALISTFVSSITGTLILVLAPSMDWIGAEFHLSICKSWACLSLILSLYRLVLQYKNQMKSSHLCRLQLETVINLAQVYILIRYLPVIHPGFSLKDNMQQDVRSFVGKLIPLDLHSFVYESIPNCGVLISAALNRYYNAVPNSLI